VLDDALPQHVRRVPTTGAGTRALGTRGRSLLLVLEDARVHLRSLRDAGKLDSKSQSSRPSAEGFVCAGPVRKPTPNDNRMALPTTPGSDMGSLHHAALMCERVLKDFR